MSTKPLQPLNKFLATHGVVSRRKAVELIQTKRITVNGIVITNPAFRVDGTEDIRYDDIKLNSQKKLYIVMNKPKDYITTVSDERNRRCVTDLLKPTITERVFPVGRLDRTSTGVLLLTNDGDLAYRLTHPKYTVEKVYRVTLNTALKKADMQALLAGLTLQDGFMNIDAITTEPKSNGTIVHVTIHSGKNRIIRRLFDYLGYSVIALDRIKFAHFTKQGLRIGQWRLLDNDEIYPVTRSQRDNPKNPPTLEE